MILQDIQTYKELAKKFEERYHLKINRWELIRFFPAWVRSQDPKFNPIVDRKPWLVFAAIQFLERNLRRDMSVYEYGAGGSTLFFAERVREVVAVEHDKDWISKVSRMIEECGYRNCKLSLIEPTEESISEHIQPSNLDAYISANKTYPGYSFKEYATSIENYCDEYFDLVAIDGRARPSCCKHSMQKVKKGGFLLLDNSERTHYRQAVERFDGQFWEQHVFSGPVPYAAKFSQTSIWRKRK
jgi:hypothetical protein